MEGLFFKHTLNGSILTQMLIKIFPSQLLMNSVGCTGGLISAILVGNALPSICMSSVGICFPIHELILVISLFFSIGSGIVCSKAMGRGEIDKIGKVFFSAAITILSLSLLLASFFFFNSLDIIYLLGAESSEIALSASLYLFGLGFGVFPLIMNPCLLIFLQLGNEAPHSMVSSAIQVVTNATCAIISTFLLDGGILGISISLSIAAFSSFFYLIFCFARKKNLIKPKISSEYFLLLKEIIIMGFPASFAMLLYALRDTIIVSHLAVCGGTDALAALAIMNSSIILLLGQINGFRGSVSIISGMIVGEHDGKMLEKLFESCLKVAFVIGLTTPLLYSLFAKYIVLIFDAKGEIAHLATFGIISFSLSFVITHFNAIFTHFYQSIGRLGIVSLLQVCENFLFPILAVFILENYFGVYGILSCYPFGILLSSVLIISICTYQNGKLPSNPADFLWLKKDFGENKGISISLYSIEDAIGISTLIEKYCNAHGVDKQIASKCALCIEELAVNYIQNGYYEAKKKKYEMDIHFTFIDGSPHIRLRDNGKPLDPMDCLKVHTIDESDPCKNIGIRMVSKIAQDMNYLTTFGMNTLNIVI